MKNPEKLNSLLRAQIKGGVTVCLPTDINLLTPYVLLEQEDWFEDEIKFIRELLRPGMSAVDIGANYGVYTLTAAAAVGTSGKVWAFEPTCATAAYLQASIHANQFDHIQLVQVGVSDKIGAGLLKVNSDSELNAVVMNKGGLDSCEEIELTTVDEWAHNCGWPLVDFVKIDAEGHEKKIIEGGCRFFEGQSPLVMYEIRERSKWNLELVDRFRSLGYENYRLVPGLNLLVPFREEQQPDSFLLNLFACKPDRAARLAAENYLVPPYALCSSPAPAPETWRHFLTEFPYARKLQQHWAKNEKSRVLPDGEIYRQALSLYASAKDKQASAADRYACLQQAFDIAGKLILDPGRLPRLFSFARIAMELGERSRAKDTIV